MSNSRRLSPRFEPIFELGCGGQGVVFAARDVILGREVAVKVLSQAIADDPIVREQLVREARAAASLKHRDIVAVYDIDVDRGFIVMELVRGESLEGRLARVQKLPAREVRRIGVALLGALHAAHEAGIVHRDVKPGNVLLDASGDVKLTDFGIASCGSVSRSRSGSGSGSRSGSGLLGEVGTPAYMAPEQLRGVEVDRRADVYSAGVTLFEAATGMKLHTPERSIADPHGAVLEATGDPALAAAISRAVREEVGERPGTAQAFAELLFSKKPPRRAMIAGLSIAAALVLSALLFLRPKPAEINEPIRVALLPFEHTIASPSLAYTRAGLPQLLAMELEHEPALELVGYYRLLGHVSSAQADLSEWTRAAQSFNADVLVRGELAEERGSLRLTIVVTDLGGRAIARIERPVAPEHLPELVRSSAREVVLAIVGRTTSLDQPSARSFEVERRLLLGIGALEDHRISDAIRELEAAQALDPRSADVAYALAVAFWWDERGVGRVAEQIEIALAGHLSAPRRGFLGALRLLVELRYAEAEVELRGLEEQFPDFRDILYGRFEALYHSGRPAEAIALYRKLDALDPAFRLGVMHAYAYYLAHGDEEGMTWMERRIGPAEESSHAAWRARVLVARRDYDGAIALVGRMVERAEDQTFARSTLSHTIVEIHAVRGQLDLAIADLSSSTAQIGELPTLAPMFALYLARGDVAKARAFREHVEQTLDAREPGWPRLDTWITIAQLDLGRGSTSLAAIELVLEREARLVKREDDLRYRVVRALLAGARGTIAEASSAIPEVRAIEEAFLAEKRGELAAAIAAWRRAIAASSDGRFLIDERAFLARLLERAGDREGALRECRELLEPRLFYWSWAVHARPCRELTGNE